MAKSQNRIMLGIFEVAVFLSKGVTRFPQDRRAALWSFLVIAGLSLLTSWMVYMAPTDRLGVRPFSELVVLYLMVDFGTLALFYGAVYLVCRKLDKDVLFWPFVTIGNFTALAPALMSLPLSLAVIYGPHSWEDIYNLLIVIFFYSVALRGFVTTYALRVPWEFGAAVGFFAMFIGQAMGKTVFYFWGIA